MAAIKTLFFVALFAASCFAVSVPPRRYIDLAPCNGTGFETPCPMKERKRIVGIEHDSIAIPLVHQGGMDVNFAVDRTQSGFGRLTAVGVRVQIGVSATLNYNVSVRGVSSERIFNSTDIVSELLDRTDRERLDSLMGSYNNGLSVPLLSLLGIDLGGTTTRESMIEASRFIENYNEVSTALENVLETTERANVQISGSITATGVSFIPVEGLAFIRTARIRFNDGSSTLVVTSDADETEAATIRQDGTAEILPSSGKTLSVTESFVR